VAKLKSFSNPNGEKGVIFKCPGCGDYHSMPTENSPHYQWGFNGDLNKPTLTPSILIRTGHHNPLHKGPDCWCNFDERFPERAPVEFHCYVCHSFVTDGKIQFLSDCTHALAGQTIELPEIEADDGG
jgi:hypothetical protein